VKKTNTMSENNQPSKEAIRAAEVVFKSGFVSEHEMARIIDRKAIAPLKRQLSAMTESFIRESEQASILAVEAEDLKARNAELLAALRSISSTACQDRGNAIELKEMADDAIASAESGESQSHPNQSEIRMSEPAKLNKTEAAFEEFLRNRIRQHKAVHTQSVTLLLPNGVRYMPDFSAWSKEADEFPELYEVMRDDAAVNIKVAATTYPHFIFFLVRRDKSAPSGWKIEEVSP
jgi:hypothetical protein